MDVLFFAFANDPLRPLAHLQQEADEIRRLLSPGELEGRYLLKLDPFATRNKVSYYLTLYKDHLIHFHYSGHAGKDVLVTEGEPSQSEGLAQLLGQCPKLNCVFLNGCATLGQVQGLWNKEVPAVLATQTHVEDKLASEFAIRFYQALSIQNELEAAFEQAKGEALTLSPRLNLAISRHFVLADAQLKEKENGTFDWKLYIQEGRENVLSWKLPEQINFFEPKDFTPNVVLIQALLEALEGYSREIRNLLEAENEGEEIDVADKRLAILNSLPAPVAEQLRKLMVPFSEKDKGYDKISQSRVEQLVKTYDTLIELFAYTLLAQVWEAIDHTEKITLLPSQRELLKSFLRVHGPNRKSYDFIPLIQSLTEVLEQNGIDYFMEELSPLQETYQAQSPFVWACHFLNGLRQQLDTNSLATHEIAKACIQGETQLATVFKELGFLANYIMAAIRKIDVVKYRHVRTARFNHSLVRLVKVMGGLEIKEEELDEFMDSRSVLLLKKKKGSKGKSYMNLSPFVIDQNAFEDKQAEISKVYFFYGYDPQQERYNFRHVDKPEDQPLVIPKENYEIVPDQFNAFAQLIFNRPMAAL